MVTYISVGDLRRLQHLSRHREELLPPVYPVTVAGGPPDAASCAPIGLVGKDESSRLRSLHSFFRRERRFAVQRLKQALAERRGRESESTTDAAGIIAAAEIIASEETGPGFAARPGLAEEEKSEASSVPSTVSLSEPEDADDVLSEDEQTVRRPKKEEVEKHTQEAHEKLQAELASMRVKIPELLQRKKYADAEKVLGYYLQLFPRLRQLYFFGIRLYMGQRRYADAIDMCWAGLFCAPGNAKLTLSLLRAEELLAQQASLIPQRYKAALFNFSAEFLQAARDKEQSISRMRFLGDGRFVTVRESERLHCVANCSLEPGDLVLKERPYIATPMLLLEELDSYGSAPTSDQGGNRSSPSSPTPSSTKVSPYNLSSNQSSSTMTNGSVGALQGESRRRRLRLFSTCFHCLQERRIPDRGFACTKSPYTCPFVFCSWECLLRNARVHEKECSLLPFVLAAAKEAHLSPTSVLHFFRFLIRAGLERDQGIASLRAGVRAVSAQQRAEAEELDMLDRLLSLPSLRENVEEGQPELYHRISFLMRRVQKELPAQHYCFLKHEELVDAMLTLLQRSPTVVSGSTAAALSRRDPSAAVGLVFGGATAMLSHSCIPTCCVDFSEEGELFVRSICNVPVGGSLCISMVPDLFEPTSRRKHPHALPCVFGCGCSRCSDPTEGNRHLRGIRCPACNRGYCNPNNSRSLLLRLRAYGSSGPRGKHMSYWQKIWTEQQQKYARTLALMRQKQQDQQQLDLKQLMQERYMLTKTGGRRKEEDVDIDEEFEDGVRFTAVQELLRQVEAGPAATARAFANDYPYALLSEAMREYQVRSHLLATAALAQMGGGNKSGLTGAEAKEVTPGMGGAAHVRKAGFFPSSAETPPPGVSSIFPSSPISQPHGALSPPGNVRSVSPTDVPIRPVTDTEEMWQCSFCGRVSLLLSEQCRAIEKRAALLAAAAAAALEQGKPLPARTLLQALIDRYSVVLHPHHWRLYYAHVVAAGLYLSQPQQHLQQALLYMRRAIIAAAAVLPVCHREKALLYTKLAELEFTQMQQQKLVNRTAAVPSPAVVLEPLYAALHNATVCCGSKSAFALTCLHRIRIYAGALGRATPPLAFTLHLRPIPTFLAFYRRLFGRGAGSDDQIQRMVEDDPFQVAAAITRRGFCDDVAIDLLKTFSQIHHLSTGLSPVALAAGAAHIPLVKRMLQAGFDFLAANEWGVTPLLAMAARSLPAGPVATSSGPASISYCSFPHSTEAAADDSNQASLLRLLLRACDERDAAASSPAAKSSTAAAKALSAAAGAEPKASTSGGGGDGTLAAAGGAAAAEKTKKKEVYVVSCAYPSERSGFKEATSYRELLLGARTHRLLGLNGVFHLAAARGKKELCKQLLRAGQSLSSVNAEGATPLHLAALAADGPTVQALLDYQEPTGRHNSQSDVRRLINARTERGETPLMLAAYGLQRDTVSLLLLRGADVNAVAHREQLTALHALAIGVCRDYEVQQQPLDLRGDAGAAALLGLNDYSLSAGIYSRGISTPLSPSVREQDQQDVVDMRVPLVSRLPPDLLLFPHQMLWRLTEAIHIAQLLLRPPCSNKTLLHVCRSGYTAEHLLQQLWKQFMHRRAQLLLQSEMRLSALTREDRYEIGKGWADAEKLMFILRDLFVVAQVAAKEETKERRQGAGELPTPTPAAQTSAAAPIAGDREEDETPRPEDIARRRREQLEREAPWMFYGEQRKKQQEEQRVTREVRSSDGSKKAASSPPPPPPPKKVEEAAATKQEKAKPPPPPAKAKPVPPPSAQTEKDSNAPATTTTTTADTAQAEKKSGPPLPPKKLPLKGPPPPKSKLPPPPAPLKKA